MGKGSSKGDHGLLKQIAYIEENIAIRKELGKDYSFEEELVEEWRRYLPGGDKHHLWSAHSKTGYRFESIVHKPLVKK